ncbi:MAG: hypothetical protein ACI8RD_001637, partial [Bacillariaceae sp.]
MAVALALLVQDQRRLLRNFSKVMDFRARKEVENFVILIA